MKEKPLCVWTERFAKRDFDHLTIAYTYFGITINITLNMRPIRILVLVLQIILDRQNIGISITTNIQPSEYWY